MCSCYYKAKLAEPDFFRSEILNHFLLPTDFIVAAKKKLLLKKIVFSLIVFLIFAATCFAQQRITRIVTTLNGSPLSGVSVGIKGSATGATTNADGNFIISANANDVLLISHVGYVAREITVVNETSLKISRFFNALSHR